MKQYTWVRCDAPCDTGLTCDVTVPAVLEKMKEEEERRKNKKTDFLTMQLVNEIR